VKRIVWLSVLLGLAGIVFWLYRQMQKPAITLPNQPRTIESTVAALAPILDPIWQQRLAKVGVAYPPAHLVMIAWKQERLLEIHAGDTMENLRFVYAYPILAASGQTGPKLREGDRQVPEGFYRIELLNPNSRFHLSLRVNYPSPEDVLRAKEEGRDINTLGGDIMIHGNAVSTGCLAIGDPAIEELFLLVARTGLDHIELLIAPKIFSSTEPPDNGQPRWVQDRYERLCTAIAAVRKKDN
jgi:L,D-transpeptidase catalytic domain